MKDFRMLIVMMAALAAGCGVSAAQAGESKTWRIMPVGDSITEGGGSFSVYRYPLLKLLTEAGYAVEYVGSKASDSPAGKLRHEGYGGKNAEYIASIIGDHFREHPADLVLIHAGHNHFEHERPIPGICAATEKMIADIRATNPRVIVLLAQVVTSGKLPKYSYIPGLNKQLAELGKKLDTPDSPVIVVDQAAGWDWRADTVADHVHPNAQGAQKMARRWFDALAKVMSQKKHSTAEDAKIAKEKTLTTESTKDTEVTQRV